MILDIFLIIYGLLVTVLLVVFVYRLFQYDRLVKFLTDDVLEALTYLNGLAKREIFANSPEIIAAHNMFASIARKLERYRDVIKKSSFTATVTNEEKPKDRRPVAID